MALTDRDELSVRATEIGKDKLHENIHRLQGKLQPIAELFRHVALDVEGLHQFLDAS